jgi:hypothetical protein
MLHSLGKAQKQDFRKKRLFYRRRFALLPQFKWYLYLIVTTLPKIALAD